MAAIAPPPTPNPRSASGSGPRGPGAAPPEACAGEGPGSARPDSARGLPPARGAGGGGHRVSSVKWRRAGSGPPRQLQRPGALPERRRSPGSRPGRGWGGWGGAEGIWGPLSLPPLHPPLPVSSSPRWRASEPGSLLRGVPTACVLLRRGKPRFRTRGTFISSQRFGERPAM